MSRINILRSVGDKLNSHLCMQVKDAIITKPGALIPGAMAATGMVMTLNTKENQAHLTVQNGDSQVQSATFNYRETDDGYELVSATSAFLYDDDKVKEIQQNIYSITPEQEEVYEHSINYASAPMRETTRASIDKINASVAQAAGYQSDITDYDPQEIHTYGKKSLLRDKPVLLQFFDQLLEAVAPNSKFAVSIKEKQKKDKTTSLVAFKVNDAEHKNEIARGFMSADGDSVTYHIDTDDMTIVGEKSPNTDLSRAYLKSKQAVTEQGGEKESSDLGKTVDVTENSSDGVKKEDTPTVQKVAKKRGRPRKILPAQEEIQFPETLENSELKQEEPKIADKTKKVTTGETTAPKKTEAEVEEKKEQETPEVSSEPAPEIQQPIVKTDRINSPDYYTELISNVATNKNLSIRDKIEKYERILAYAYLDGYNPSELDNILIGKFSKNPKEEPLHKISKDCRKSYVTTAIAMVEDRKITQAPDFIFIGAKVKELQKLKIDVAEEDLRICVQSVINELAKIKDDNVKLAYVDRALNILKNSSSENFQSDLLSFIEETSKLNEELKFHYEIYLESVNNTRIETLKIQIEKMINNISDSVHYDKRSDFLTKLYLAKNRLNELLQLQSEIQLLLDEQHTPQDIEESPESEELPQKPSIESLSGKNKALVEELLSGKRPRDISLTYSDVRNLLLNMGFIETHHEGSHHKFEAPFKILIKGRKQSALVVAGINSKSVDSAAISDLISICKQYYGNKK